MKSTTGDGFYDEGPVGEYRSPTGRTMYVSRSRSGGTGRKEERGV